MDALTTLAVAKVIKKKALDQARSEVEVGTHELDALVRVYGSLTVGADFEQVQHMKVPQWELIAVLLSKVNGATLESVVAEALGYKDQAELKRIKASAQAAVSEIKGAARVATKGKVTTSLKVEAVSGPAIEVETETEAAIETEVA